MRNLSDQLNIEDKIKKHLGIKQFFTIKDLVTSGLFGGKTSVHYAIKHKKLPFIHLSERRYVIMRDDLIKILEQKYSNAYLPDHEEGKKRTKS